ncbi:hypothetical protein AB0H58_31215 [Nocardia neocaledoniensis]|uniref:phage tail protein n=1 Tax=Nocardia neocaledoniensis TaxID=236511 RepID=UPI0033E25D94
MTQPFASAHVKAELDWNNLDAELLARVRVAARKAEAALRAHFAQVQLATGVKLTANAANFRTEARKALAKISLDTAVTLTPKLSNFRAQARAALAAVALTHDVTLTVNTATLPRDIRQALREIANNFDFEIKIRAVPDFSRFPADVLRSLAEIRRNFNFEIPIRAALDDAAARAALDRLTRDRTVDVNVRRRGGLGDLGSGGGLGGLNLSSLAKGTAIASAVAAAIAAIGGAAGVAVGAISGLALALASLGPVAVAGIATAAVGLKGLGDAFKATSAASQSSAADSKAAQDAIASASRNVADAEKAVKQAKKDSRTAEQDLTRARKDAQKAARDLNLEVRGGVLSEVEAQLDLKDAREELANLKPGDDYQRAQLRVAQAEQSLLETRFRNSDLAEKKAEADAKGIEGSDQVVAAQERVEAASDNVASAEQRLIDANKALADATSQTSAAQDKAAQAMAKLSPNAQAFVLATRALGPAWTDLRKSVQDKMFEGLDESITSLANAALPSLKEGMGTVATSLNGLTRGFMDFWSQTQNLDAVEQIFAGTATFIDAIGPGLQQMTTGFLAFGQAAAAQAAPLGAAFGNVLGSIGQALTNAFADGSLTAALGGVASLLNGLASGLEPLIGGLIDMVAIMGPSLGSLLTSLGTALGAIAPVLGQIGVVFADTLVAIMPQLTSFINALMTGLAPVLPVIGQLLGSIMTALTPMIGPLSQIAQIVGVALSQAFLALAPAIGPLSNSIVALIGAIAPIIPVVAQVVAGLITALAPALTTIFQALGPVIAQIAGLMLPIFQQLQPILAQVAGQIAGALVKAIEQLAPHIPAIATAFGDLVMAIAPMIPQLVEIALSLLPPLLDVVIALLPQFQKFIEVLTWLVRNVIEPYVIPYVKQMVDSLATGLETVATVITTVRDKIGGALQAIGGFFGDMKTAGGAAMDGLILGVALGVKALGKLLQRVKIPDWVPGVGGKGTESLGNSLVEWAEAKGAAQGGRVVGREVRRAASGGRLISGPGTGTSDSIPALLNGITPLRVANGEFISTAKAVEAGAPLLWALNAGWAPSPEMTRMLLGWNSAPGFAGGGMVTDNEIARMGGGSVNLSLWKAIKAKVPGAVLTSAKTDHDIDGGFHPKGQAIDVAPSRDVLDYLWANRSQLSQIIYDDPAKVWYNVNGERAEGAKARAIYGESTMAGHADHIHVAAAQDFRDTGVEAGADTGATDTRTEKQKIVDEIVSVGKEMGMSDADITAAIATGLVESELQDLDYGDRDSDGVFQQRPSQGWGSADDTVAKDARDFFERYRETDPSLSAGERAQAVQRSAYPDKYGQRMDEAATLYQESQARAKSATTDTGGASSSTSSGVQQVAVTNWPSNLGGSSSSAASSALSSSASSSTPSTSTPSTSTPTTTDTGVPSTGGPTYGIAAANDWASKQNFQRQFEDVGVSALASFAGEFGDLFGLKSQAESAVTDGVTNLRNWASTVKVAETMNFYGYDANQVATETGRMLERMTPVSETYRNG